jgi:hypothetical protein
MVGAEASHYLRPCGATKEIVMTSNTCNKLHHGDEIPGTVWRGHWGYNPEAQADVLVVDFFQNLWETYASIVPQERNLLIVDDISKALVAVDGNPSIKVVIVQGMSRFENDPRVDEILGTFGSSPTLAAKVLAERIQRGDLDWDMFDSFNNTFCFLWILQKLKFSGVAFVVSIMLKPEHERALEQLDLCTLGMHKRELFDHPDVWLGDDKLWD